MDILSQFTQLSSDSDQILTAGIQFKGRSRNTRQPVHLILLVDTSGSMDTDNKLISVKRSIKVIMDFLSTDDRVSLITFDDHATTILRCVPPTAEERDAIKYRVDGLQTNGSTNMSAGLLNVWELIEGPESGRKQGLVLLTDGHANVGVRDSTGLLQIIERILLEKPGISVTSVGYGTEHNIDLLQNVAQKGTGSYNVVMNLEDVATVFGNILGGLITVSVQNLEIELPPGAEAITSYNVKKQEDGIQKIIVGDIYADAEVTVLFKVSKAMGPIRIKGMNMVTLDPIDTLITPEEITDSVQADICFVMASLREKVAKLLLSVRARKSALPEVQELISEIQQLDRIQGHPLTAMLLEDLQMLLPLFQANHVITQEEETNMGQHAAYFGLGRGMRSVTTPLRVFGSNAAPNVFSPFASRIQEQYSQNLRSATMHAEPRNDSQYDPQEA